MLKVSQYGPVIRFDLAQSIAGRGRYWTVAYLVDGLLIDSGCAHSAQELIRFIDTTRVDQIVNTHTHEDHIGANGLLQQAHPELKILAHPLGLPILTNPRVEQPLHPYRRLFWGWPLLSHAIALSDGQVIDTNKHRFQVYFTAGHSADHLCLYEPEEGWLFTGDLFVGGQDRALRQDCDIWGMIESLKMMGSLPAKVLFPGSARVREDPAREIQAKIDYYEVFGKNVAELYRQGKTISAIIHKLCGGPMWVELVTLGHFSRYHLIASFLRGMPEY